MTYQVLARKYRPSSFSNLEGQDHISRALVNSLGTGKLHHAYLFSGTRGVGKTTIARILARCMNCEDGIKAEACGNCNSCREILEGRNVDLIEVDAASRTGVEDMRELLENVQYMPVGGRFKIYLIDEVHMLSKSSFNAMLKTLEEPPEHVKFLFATTDPKKIPVTVLSRCIQLNLKSLSVEQILHHLQIVLEAEAIDFEEAAIRLIANAADGSMRDALSLADQAIAYGSNVVGEDSVKSMLGLADQSPINDLLESIIEENGRELFSLIDGVAEYTPDYSLLLEEMVSFLHRLAVFQVVPDPREKLRGEQDKTDYFANKLDPEQLQLLYQIALMGQKDLPLAPNPRIGFEMVMLRMMSFFPSGSDSEEHSLVSSVAQNSSMGSLEADSVRDSGQSALRGLKEKLVGEKSGKTVKTEKAEISEEIKPAMEKSDSSNEEEKKNREHVSSKDELLPSDWLNVVESMKISGITKTLALNCELRSVEKDNVLLILDERHSSLFNKEHETKISAALTDFFSRKYLAEIKIGSLGCETPAEEIERRIVENKRKAMEEVNNDATIQHLVKAFDGKIDPESVVKTGS